MTISQKEIMHHFDVQGDFIDAQPYGSGHINDTYAVYYRVGGTDLRYLLQRVNHLIFKDVPALMENIDRVTTCVIQNLEKEGVQDISRKTLTLIKTLDNQSYFLDADGNYWRCYIFIEKATGHDIVQCEKQAYEAAKAFAKFQKILSNLPGKPLNETIVDFHNAVKRLKTLEDAIAKDSCSRVASCQEEIDFILNRRDLICSLVNLQETNEIPTRPTHNDCKLNNVLIDDQTGEATSVIDLDTLMPGLSLYDFGDLVRTSTSPVAEDEKDCSKVTMRMNMYKALVDGFMSEGKDYLTKKEIELLPVGGQVITITIGIRFLTDYLSGDTYFKTKYDNHNLVRARTQIALVASMEEQLEAMQNCTKDFL